MSRDVDELARLVQLGGVVVLSGAGLSTESGIPDYRGPSARTVTPTTPPVATAGLADARSSRSPMTYQTFVGEPLARRRYWARSHLGWRTIGMAEPNGGHRAVATLQRYGLVGGIVTQNVDGLHQAGGARDVIELHGSIARVTCLSCGRLTTREELDHRLVAANPGFEAAVAAVNPDGDVELADDVVAGFRPVDCDRCLGTLKPDVVFFGETVPAERVQTCFSLVEGARSLLVLGSSLTVMSGRRFVLRAVRHGIPVAIVNQGPTRGDACADVRVDAPLGATLRQLVTALRVEPAPSVRP